MRRALLPLASGLSAAAALSVEIAIVRLGAPHIGQSLLPWSAAIVSVLCGLAFGHLLGGRAGQAGTGATGLRRHLGTAWLAAGLSALAMPPLTIAVAALSQAGEVAAWPVMLGIAALAFPPSLAAGFVLPLVLRLALIGDGGANPRRVAAILAASTIGSVAGTALAGFVLLEPLGADGLARAAALVWLCLAALVMPWGAARAVAVAAGILLLLVRPASPCHIETRYTCIRLFDQALPGGGLLRLMMLDESLHSGSDRDDASRMHLAYTALVDRLARPVLQGRPEPLALFIGGGGATLPRAWAGATPPVAVTVVELDGRVAAEAAGTMWAAGPAITTIIGDGRAALRGLPPGTLHDVVLLDAYRTLSVPPHLVTRDYASLVRQHLAGGGVYLSNIVDRAATMQLTHAVAATLGSVFAAVDIWVMDGEGGDLTNTVVAAWRDPPDPARASLLRVATTVWTAAGAVGTEEVAWRRLDLDGLARFRPGSCPLLLTDDWTPVDRLIAGRFRCPAGGVGWR